MGYFDNEYGKLRKVLLCPPKYFRWEAINEVAKKNLEMPQKFSYELALEQHNELADALRTAGVEVYFIEPSEPHHYMVYTRDFGKNVERGVLLGRFRLPVRMGEEDLFEKYLREKGFPIVGKVACGAFEGGDVHFVDRETMAVGVGARSTMEAVESARKILSPEGVDVIPVKFDPKYLHLDLLFVVIAEKLCLACPEGLPEDFLNLLKKKKFELIEVSKEDAMQLKNNVLAIDEKTILSFKENTEVNKKLKAYGFEVLTPHLSMFTMGGGGPRCLTFPLERDDVK
jgi:N-dimethylarginine dimethylaminohydrolase